MSFADLQAHANKATRLKLDSLSTNLALKDDPSFHKCVSKKCRNEFLMDATITPFIKCTSCKVWQCVSCKGPRHAGQSCADYQTELLERPLREAKGKARKEQLNEDEQKSQAYMGKVLTCPDGCGAKIQKASGCDHITCESMSLSE